MQGGGMRPVHVPGVRLAMSGQHSGMLSPRPSQSQNMPYQNSPQPQTPYVNSPKPQTPYQSRFMGSRAPVQTPTGYAAADIEQAPIHDDMPIVDDDSSVGSDDDDDIVDDEVDDEEAQEDDLTLLAARSYGRKTQEQRAEGRARLVNLNEGCEDLDDKNALEGLRQASQSQESVLELASTLQECLQALIESKEKSQSKVYVRFKNNPGSAIQGSYTTVGVLLGGPDAHGRCIVQEVLPGSPAHLVGKIKKGDTILQVDMEDVTTHNIVEKIKGSDLPGSSVSITVTRPGRKRPLTVAILRATKESVDSTRQTFEMVSELAQLSGAGDQGDDIEGPASDLEKELKKRLVTSEQEKLQQEVLLKEKDASNDKTIATVKTLVAEFSRIAASKFSEDADNFRRHNLSSTGSAGSSPVTEMGALRDAALKVGRATQAVEDKCMTLRARVSGKLMGMDTRLKRVGEMSERVRESFWEKRLGLNKEMETASAATHATMNMSEAATKNEAATKLVQLQERIADCEDKLQKSRQHNSELMSQVETRELKIALLESKVQLQASQMSGGQYDNTPSASSAEPGGPAVENNAEESKRLTAELNKLKEELLRRKQQHDDELSERDRSLSELSASLFAAQDRASASMSELVTLRMENLKLKEQAVEKERKMAEKDESGQQNVTLKVELEKQNKSYKELETLYMQVQQKYVETSQELTRRTKDLSLNVQQDTEKAETSNKEQQTLDSLKEMLKRESDQLQGVRSTLAQTKDRLEAAQVESQTAKDKCQASDQLRKTLQDKYDSSEQLRKNMEDTFKRERQEGLLAMRERDALKKQRAALKLEIEKLEKAKDAEIEEIVRTEQLRWKRNFEMIEKKFQNEGEKETEKKLEAIKAERDSLLAELEGGQVKQKDAQERTRRELEEKRREVQQAQRERDSLKVEMDESRYVIGQLSAEVTDLRSKVAPAMHTSPHNISPHNVQVPLVPPPQVQRSGPPPLPPPQGNLAGPPMPQHLSGTVMSQQQQHERDDFFRAHAQSPGPVMGAGPGLQFPPAQQGLTRQSSAGNGGGGGGGVVPAKPVGVYSNRAGRLFAM